MAWNITGDWIVPDPELLVELHYRYWTEEDKEYFDKELLDKDMLAPEGFLLPSGEEIVYVSFRIFRTCLMTYKHKIFKTEMVCTDDPFTGELVPCLQMVLIPE